jgi:hypothetical protein
LLPLTGPSEFVLARYNTIKQHNPDLPVLIREADGTPARFFARFGQPIFIAYCHLSADSPQNTA